MCVYCVLNNIKWKQTNLISWHPPMRMERRDLVFWSILSHGMQCNAMQCNDCYIFPLCGLKMVNNGGTSDRCLDRVDNTSSESESVNKSAAHQNCRFHRSFVKCMLTTATLDMRSERTSNYCNICREAKVVDHRTGLNHFTTLLSAHHHHLCFCFEEDERALICLTNANKANVKWTIFTIVHTLQLLHSVHVYESLVWLTVSCKRNNNTLTTTVSTKQKKNRYMIDLFKLIRVLVRTCIYGMEYICLIKNVEKLDKVLME